MISVIITTYGGSNKLARAINSVVRQSDCELEVIVVDDNNPNTKERLTTEGIMSNYATNKYVKYIKHQENKNGAVARNTGIEAARGQYICFLDDDDYYLDGRMAFAERFLDENEQYVGVCNRVAYINNSYITKIDDERNNDLELKEFFMPNGGIGTGSNIFLRSELVKDIQGFDGSFLRFQDLEFMIRILQKGKVKYCSELMIVKDVSGNRIPQYSNVRTALKVFNSKFWNVIEQLGMEKTYIDDRYNTLLTIARLNADSKEIVQARREYEEHTGAPKMGKQKLNLDIGVCRIKHWLKSDNLSVIRGLIMKTKYQKKEKQVMMNIDSSKFREIKYLYIDE